MKYVDDDAQELFFKSSLFLQIILNLIDQLVHLYETELILVSCDRQYAAVCIPDLSTQELSEVLEKINHQCMRHDKLKTIELVDEFDGSCVVSVTNFTDFKGLH